MNKRIIGGLAAFAAGLGIAVAAPAQAMPSDPGSSPYGGGYIGDRDAYSYWNELDELGTGFSVSQAKDFGVTMCQALSNGMSEGQLVSIGVQDGLPGGAVRLAVHGAEYHFCPTYY